MECPKCKKTVGENDLICKNCGLALHHGETDKNGKKHFFKKKKKSEASRTDVPLLETTLPKKHFTLTADKEKKLKIVFIACAVLILIILVWILIAQMISGKGRKIAEGAADFIGAPITEIESELDLHFKDNSAYEAVNNAAAFDYVYECEDEVKLDGCAYPEWAVYVLKNDNNKVESVTYADYKQLKKDSRGTKLDKKVNLDEYDKGVKLTTVTDSIDAEPFRIVYTDETISYIYRYYYTNSSSDEQSVILTVVSDKKGKYQYYTSVNTYPDFV